MKRLFFALSILVFNFSLLKAETKINIINEGDIDAKITLIVYESLTCSHCADFHKNVYPDLKKDFIDKGLVKIEFRNFPLDLAAFNASKVAHCQNDGKSNILHFLYERQKEWVRGNALKQLQEYLRINIQILKARRQILFTLNC